MNSKIILFAFIILFSFESIFAIGGDFQIRLTSAVPSIVRVCVKEYQWNIVQDGRCLLGKSNSTLFPERERFLQIPFAGIWPGNISLIVDLFNGKEERIGGLAWRGLVAGRDDWNNKISQELNVSYRFACNENFYGAQCEKICRDTDNISGHYSCGNNGEKICKKGWEGNQCNKPKCNRGCGKGKCVAPDTCSCPFGFTGFSCNVCIPSKDCLHGTCSNNKPGTCACKPGWTGHFCDKDLHYCTHHSPCKNGGTCSNGRLSKRQKRSVEYTCTCPNGFGGVDCEISRTEHICENNDVCHNGGKCIMNFDNSSSCICPRGFKGIRCEYDTKLMSTNQDPCKENPCRNDATCLARGSVPVCLCSSYCFSGPLCSIVNHECLVNAFNSSSRSFALNSEVKNDGNMNVPMILLGFISLGIFSLAILLAFYIIYRMIQNMIRNNALQNVQPGRDHNRTSDSMSANDIYKIDLCEPSYKDAPPPYYQTRYAAPSINSGSIPVKSCVQVDGDRLYMEMKQDDTHVLSKTNQSSSSSLASSLTSSADLSTNAEENL